MTAGERGWGAFGETFRNAPFGVLVLGVLLALVGIGLLCAAIYLLVTGRGFGWMMLASALAFAPLCLYVALHLVRLSRWAWLAIVAVLVLLLVSSLARAALSRQPPVSPAGEAVVEVVLLAYLLRGRVRRAFGWG